MTLDELKIRRDELKISLQDMMNTLIRLEGHLHEVEYLIQLMSEKDVAQDD